MSKKTPTIVKSEINLDKMATSAFKDKTTKAYAAEYLAGIRENWQQTEKAIRGSIPFLVFLVVIFELLQRSAVEEINMGPIKLKELSFIYRIIPILIAHYFYSVCNFTLMLATYRTLHKSILKVIHPSLVKMGIEKFLTPPYFSIFGDITFIPSNSRFYSPFNFLQFIFVFTVIFSPIVFEVYAFYRLFNLFGITDMFSWISLAISLILLVMGFLLISVHSESQAQK